MRSTELRRDKILQLLIDRGGLQVADLMAHCRVSAATIRNDLAVLAQRGMLARRPGGATLDRAYPTEQAFRDKDRLNLDGKRRIGERAAGLVGAGDKLIIDSGTTTAMLALHLRTMRNLTVMTNGLNVAHSLADAPDVELLLTGGLLRRQSLSLHGGQAESGLGHYIFDKLFLGIDGCDLQFGMSTHDAIEASLNREMAGRARQVIVLADSSKFNRVALHHILPLERVHTIITDCALSQPYGERMAQLGIGVIVAD